MMVNTNKILQDNILHITQVIVSIIDIKYRGWINLNLYWSAQMTLTVQIIISKSHPTSCHSTESTDVKD